MFIAKSDSHKDIMKASQMLDDLNIGNDFTQVGSDWYLNVATQDKGRVIKALRRHRMLSKRNPFGEIIGTALASGVGFATGILGVKKLFPNPGASWHREKARRNYRVAHDRTVPSTIRNEARITAEESLYDAKRSDEFGMPNPVQVWKVVTPSGYILRRAIGSKKEVERYAKEHYITYRVVKDKMYGLNPALKVSNELVSYLDRIKSDRKAGHKDALDYWEGAAAGALIEGNTNPLIEEGHYDNIVEYLNENIRAPYVRSQVSTLGGIRNASALITVSLDNKSDWNYGILQNSRYFMIHIHQDGSMELFSKQYTLPKMRKTRVKSIAEAVDKINSYIESIHSNPLKPGSPEALAAGAKARETRMRNKALGTGTASKATTLSVLPQALRKEPVVKRTVIDMRKKMIIPPKMRGHKVYHKFTETGLQIAKPEEKEYHDLTGLATGDLWRGYYLKKGNKIRFKGIDGVIREGTIIAYSDIHKAFKVRKKGSIRTFFYVPRSSIMGKISSGKLVRNPEWAK